MVGDQGKAVLIGGCGRHDYSDWWIYFEVDLSPPQCCPRRPSDRYTRSLIGSEPAATSPQLTADSSPGGDLGSADTGERETEGVVFIIVMIIIIIITISPS